MKTFTGILFLPLFSSALLLLIDNAGAEESALERFQRANEAFDLKCLQIVNGKRIEKEVDHQQEQLNKTSANSELELLPSTGNTFISSFSIGSVLSMALAGAGGDTYQALQNLLGYKNLETMEVLMAYKLISSRLQTTTTTATAATAAKNNSSNQQQQQQQQLNIANSLAIDKSVTLPYFYLQNIASFFEGNVFREDFSSALLAGKALKEINAWISQQTGGKIPQFFDSNSEQQLNQIKLLLLSAVYFKNDWRWKFPKNETKKADFQTSQSATKQVEMMHLKAPLRYARSSGWAESESFWELLELPYQNVSSSQERSAKQLAMYVFLPSSSKSNKSVLHSYSLHTLNSLIEQLSPYPKVVVQLPKFHLKSSYSLKKPLEPWLGDSAFSPSKANFSGMIEGNNTGDDHRLYIGEILHKAVISVDEEGAEAAAVTDTEVHPMPHPGPPPPPSPHFIANRPFVFVIREVDTSPEQKGVILFSGAVNDP